MSQASKRPGARDISELKARLGLKKSAPSADKRPAAGGVVPPPGARVGAVPAPPGAQPPQPELPDASEDPFGAMNAMAAHATATSQAEQQIVVVNDGRPVESVEKRSFAARFGKPAAIAAVPLFVGIIIGNIGKSSAYYNRTIDDAGAVLEDVREVKQSLIAVQQTFQEARTRGEGGNAFKSNDEELTEALEALELKYPDFETLYDSFLYDLPSEMVGSLMTLYTETAIFYEDLDKHIEQSKADAKIIKDGQVKLAQIAKTPYAGMIEMPKKGQGGEEAAGPQVARFKFVQLGPPVCPNESKPNPQGCGAGVVPRGHQYRISEMGNWGVKELTELNGEFVKGDRLIYFDPRTPVYEQIAKGGKATVAEAAYMRRITALEEKLKELIELRTVIEKKLNNKSQEGHKFSFFM